MILFMCCLSTITKANREKDAGLWVNLGITHKPFSENWSATYSLEYRAKDNFSATSLWCGAINVYYSLNSYIKAGAGYEFFLNRESDGKYTPEHRYYPAVLFTYRKGLLTGSFRSYMMNTFTEWAAPNWESRNRLKLTYQLKDTPLKAFVAAEPYHTIYPAVDKRFKKIRYTAGGAYSFKQHTLDIYYLRENFKNRPLVNNIIAIDYNLSF